MNGYGAPRLSDPFNTLGLRNINNTIKRYYNCGGYALGTFSWYWPVRGRTRRKSNHCVISSASKTAPYSPVTFMM